ncbi:MAG: UdgX family uracil-DNA binding protein [Verrucomicrobia bacterium]|nr:UdgX family uracil-DNA binding protein [Verrucomicrobiota bacterium]MBV8485790.1 UdgX family uracil-DNA binding protein [Verrucomicrobiota bacterium]
MGTVRQEKTSFLKPSDELPDFVNLKGAEISAQSCRRCPLWERATQTVFGAGASHARVVFVGEQPGDAEDRMGLPFVGPAGRLLDRALNQAQINRDLCYVTNAVKHFKWEPLGQRRLHKKPTSREIQACRPWLEAEIELIQPEVVVGLGATAAASIFGVPVRIADVRGKLTHVETVGRTCLITAHPSSVLRAPDSDTRQTEFDRLVQDLTLLQEFVR